MSFLRYGYLISVFTALRNELPSEVLDVGFGNGDFLRVCANAGIRAFGYDISGYPLNDERISVVDWESVMNCRWSVITFFDSLEHIQNLDFVQNLQAEFLVISVPWCHWSIDDQEFWRWKHRRPHEHLHHFGADSMNRFMEKRGFKRQAWSNIEDGIRGQLGAMPFRNS